MAKPICVIKVDNRMQDSRGIAPIYEVQRLLDERLSDYHVLVVPFEQPQDEYYEPMQVQVFHEKDFTEIQYEELKRLVMESLPSNGG